MKVLLINPAYFDSRETAQDRFVETRDVIAKGNMYVWPFEPPLGLASLVSFLRSRGQDAELLDLQAQPLSPAMLEEYLRQRAPDLVGITVMTTTFPAALALAREVKAILPSAKIVFGGPHPTIMPEQTLEEGCVDYVVCGEGEYPLWQLTKGDHEGIEGLWYKKGGRIMGQGTAPLIRDLDSLPMPDYHSFPAGKYIDYNKVLRSLNSISMIVSRGCPYRCSFCAVKETMGKSYRIRDPRKVVAEMQLLQRDFGIEGIWFKDSIFNLRKEWVREFCSEIRRTGLKLRWQINTRVDLVDEEQVAEMAACGLEQIDLGIESGSPETLKTLRKDVSIETIEKAVAAVKRHVRVSGFFMVGVPGEKLEDVEMTFELARRLDLDRASWSMFTPLPGSQLFEDLSGAGKIGPQPDWRQVHFINSDRSYAEIPHARLKERFEEIQRHFTGC